MGLGPVSQQQMKVEEVYMKERILKWGVPLFLVAVLVAAGVYPITSQAAAKGTTYNVVLQKGSATVSLVSINAGASAPSTSPMDGVSFKMVVEAKAKTEKLKTGPASYYPVTILAKSYKAPTSKFPMVGGGGMALVNWLMAGDAKGKLYISGGDVDVTVVQGAKKATTQIGDGKVDPAGSLIIRVNLVQNITMESTGKMFMQTKTTTDMTTGQSYIIVKGSKSRLEGKALPNDDTTKTLPTPLVGQPLDLDAGTGTLVGTNGLLNVKNKTLGVLDYLTDQSWVMKITK